MITDLLNIVDEARIKNCSKCGVPKTLDEFYANPMGTDGLFPWCKLCHCAQQKQYKERNPEARKAVEVKSHSRPEHKKRVIEKQRERRKKDPEKARDSALRYRYGISFETFQKMIQDQDGKCFLCGTPNPGKKGWHPDHLHGCCLKGKTCVRCLRKILCARCNLFLGQFETNLLNLFQNVKYICQGVVNA